VLLSADIILSDNEEIKIDEERSFLTTFYTPFGCYRITRVPFGIHSVLEVCTGGVPEDHGHGDHIQTKFGNWKPAISMGQRTPRRLIPGIPVMEVSKDRRNRRHLLTTRCL